MITTYVALDPGGTTGWATCQFEEIFNPVTEEVEVLNVVWRRGHIGPQPHHTQLYNFLGLSATEGYRVITESFEYRNRARAGLVLVSLEYIGVAQLFCNERGIPLVKQTASMGKGFAKDRNLERLGLWRGTKWKHAMDATRHLIYFIVMNSDVPKALKMRVLERGFK